jgi:hypothetical protein
MGILEMFLAAGVLVSPTAVPVSEAIKETINVEIGGVISGPNRRYVDLDDGVVFIGNAAVGAPVGDAAGITTDALLLTKRSLSEPQKLALRRLAIAVLEKGAERPFLLRPCFPSADRIVKLDIVIGQRSRSGVVYCLSESVEALINAVFVASRN